MTHNTIILQYDNNANDIGSQRYKACTNGSADSLSNIGHDDAQLHVLAHETNPYQLPRLLQVQKPT